MVPMKKSLPWLAFGLTVVALATPSFGQSQSRENQTGAARNAAIHCSVRASKYGGPAAPAANPLDTVSPSSPFQMVYGTCMAEHGQHLLDRHSISGCATTPSSHTAMWQTEDLILPE
jgi:hypothetical protein